jgi:hypothetical protein
MSKKSIELAVMVPAETKLAVELVAAEQRISVSQFIENVMQKNHYVNRLLFESLNHAG